MKWIKKEYVKALEWGFKTAYVLLGLATFNAFLYDSPIQPFLVKICLVLGLLALGGRLIFFRDYIRTPYWVLLALFCGVFFLSMAVNREYGGFAADLKWLIWTGFLFFLLYLCDSKRSIEAYKKEFCVFAHILIGYSAIAAGAGLYLMSRLYHQTWFTDSNELMLAGFQWGRLWGVYTDPNYGSVFSVAAVLLCVYFVKIRRTWKKIPYILIILLDYLYIIFSDSRTAEAAMAVSASFWILYTAVHKRNGTKRLLAGLLAAAVFSGAFIGATSFLKAQYNTKIQKQINERDARLNGNITIKQPAVSPQVGRKADIEADVSNGRLALWKSGIEVWKTKPVLGTGYNSFLPYVKEHMPQTYAVNNKEGDYVSLHNEYVNILVYHGILGAAVFLAFLFLAAFRWRGSLWLIPEQDRDYIGALSSCCIVVAVSMMFLLEGLHTNSPGAFIFWTFLGYIMHYCVKIRKVES